MFTEINYDDLNARQKEIYNFQMVAAKLNKYGFNCIKLADDWNGADFLANHLLNDTFLKVQLKARLTIHKKYLGKDLWIAFPYKNDWYIVNHDELITELTHNDKWVNTPSWIGGGSYSSVSFPRGLEEYLSKCKL